MIPNKQIINLIYFITKYFNKSIIQERIKEIVNDEFKCITKEELDIKRLSNSINYLFHNINQSFNEELVNQSYFLLSNELLDNNIINEIIEIYYKNIDSSPHSLASLLHLYIINHINKRNIEYAYLISNYIMIKNDRWFLIPYEYIFKDYKEAIENNDMSSLIRIFYDIELIKKEKKPSLLTKKEVIEKIKELKNDLINKYKIDKLYLFGSYAKNKNNEKSDLDFVVILNESLINLEKKEQIKKINNYLTEVFNCDVDLLEFSYAINSFDKSQLESLTTLI